MVEKDEQRRETSVEPRPTRILLADDDMELARVLRKGLEREGYDVTVAFDGREALAMIRDTRPALVVLDVMMPVMNGWEVCKEIRADAELAKTAVIMLTGIGPNLNEMTSPLYGADDYLDKPVDLDELTERVRTLLAR